jgi:hypothetical protein
MLTLIIQFLIVKAIVSISQSGTFVIDNIAHTSEGDILHQSFETPYTENDIEEELSRVYSSISLGSPLQKFANDTEYRYLTLQLHFVLYYQVGKKLDNVFNIKLHFNNNSTAILDSQFAYDDNSNLFNKVANNYVRRNYFISQAIPIPEGVNSSVYLEVNYVGVEGQWF